jgi:PAS domain S-box-containing protein
MRGKSARDPYEITLLEQLSTRAPGGFVLFVACLLLSTFFEMVRFPERRGWMLGFAVGLLALVVVCWSIIRARPGWSLYVLLLFVNVTGVALNAYHVIVGAPVANCLWTLTGLLASAPVVLRWGGANQAVAALGAVLFFPIHLEMGVVDPWTWAAGGSYLLVVVAMSVFGAALYDRYQRADLQLTAALSEREARLQSYFDLAPVGTAIVDADGRLREANDEICRLFGVSREELLDGPWPPFGDLRDRTQEAAQIASALTGERRAASRELRIRRRDGRTIDVSVGMRGLKGPGGVMDHAMIVVQDVTDRRRIEAEREEVLARELDARREAEAANRAKDSFLATLSHELRTPLTPILSWARVLRNGDLDSQESRRAIEAIERNAEAQSQLVEDMLDVSRIMAGKLRVTRAPVELGGIIRDAVEVVRPAARARGVVLEVAPIDDACFVDGDAARLRQVFWNLLSNGIKFTPRGGRVDAAAVMLGGAVRITVRDTGCGIARDLLPHVFERFRQGEHGTTRRHGGLGVGLAIVRELVELHGGAVSAASEGGGRGSTFTIELPLAIPAEAPRRVVKERRLPQPLNGVRVLLVDDDRDSREVVRFLLKRCGAQVEAADSARQALEMMERQRLDVLVSDIAMPDEDGYTLLGRVRAGEGGQPHVPAIALTAYSAPEDRERVLSGGFQAHVSKPVEIDELITAVNAVRGAAAS